MTYGEAKELLKAERVLLKAAQELFDAGASELALEILQQVRNPRDYRAEYRSIDTVGGE